jgi:hypothetical protein
MWPLSVIVALVFVLTAPAIAGVSEARLPGTGTFAYNGSPIVTPTPQVVVVAFR